MIDTNVISEYGKKNPDPKIVNFLHELPQESLFISVATIGEIEKGIEKIADQAKKKHLSSWFMQIRTWFEGRIITIDEDIMIEWGKLGAY
jgi:predicted nucleic acid-binding protein